MIIGVVDMLVSLTPSLTNAEMPRAIGKLNTYKINYHKEGQLSVDVLNPNVSTVTSGSSDKTSTIFDPNIEQNCTIIKDVA